MSEQISVKIYICILIVHNGEKETEKCFKNLIRLGESFSLSLYFFFIFSFFLNKRRNIGHFMLDIAFKHLNRFQPELSQIGLKRYLSALIIILQAGK